MSHRRDRLRAPHERAGFLAGVRKFADTLLIEHKYAGRVWRVRLGVAFRLAECGRSDKGLWLSAPASLRHGIRKLSSM